MIQFIFGLLALIGGIVFLVKFKAIENFFFGDEQDDDEHSVRGSRAFVFAAAGMTALVETFGIIVGIFRGCLKTIVNGSEFSESNDDCSNH